MGFSIVLVEIFQKATNIFCFIFGVPINKILINSNQSRVKMPSKNKNQTGGTYKPAEYHGANSGRYTSTPSGLTTGAYGPQVAVSQGVTHDGMAGPNLSWSAGNMLTGGGKQTGGTYLPAEYHGANSGRYTATPTGLTTGAYGPQVAVSQGVIHDGMAGPNLSWSAGNMMTGGGKRKSGCKTQRRRHYRKSTTKKLKKPHKNKVVAAAAANPVGKN